MPTAFERELRLRVDRAVAESRQRAEESRKTVADTRESLADQARADRFNESIVMSCSRLLARE